MADERLDVATEGGSEPPQAEGTAPEQQTTAPEPETIAEPTSIFNHPELGEEVRAFQAKKDKEVADLQRTVEGLSQQEQQRVQREQERTQQEQQQKREVEDLRFQNQIAGMTDYEKMQATAQFQQQRAEQAEQARLQDQQVFQRERQQAQSVESQKAGYMEHYTLMGIPRGEIDLSAPDAMLTSVADAAAEKWGLDKGQLNTTRPDLLDASIAAQLAVKAEEASQPKQPVDAGQGPAPVAGEQDWNKQRHTGNIMAGMQILRERQGE